ncbi:hypothetical protein GLOTRDRAFT_112872 [Gloeophyllum trabeum ATCC 11539]|uniref:RRM domain-containing protein n=1 Tax=Gloeophyllum trabeum (strain ATCC 11539 / FP-39264 / Madison 617) TaxID=670483 RepID=S7S2V4_GLOTA|nr:uncharacterized protein GLOTRDRAFT_112872 [Gloeophyllum trabeum ATCC 11539]EPQ60124.1 hypothetical protein GLOTRDRAFT_112872 [Gloeophyllum trabeum ATCC 11539]
MNRHHPYGSPYDTGRRGGFSGGPGPDRSHRFEQGSPSRGRGFGRGRGRGGGGGGGGGYSNNFDAAPGPYDQAPPQGDMNASYNQYGTSQGQDLYQNNGYGGSGQYGGAPDSDGYDQGYGNYNEDDSGYSGSGGGGYGSRPPKRQRRERDDKVHDSIIEERIQRERPCRTLFIRNIKYETDSNDVRRRFEEHGDIKTFFDLIANRGMVFVTYYDLRAAERARERLQGSEISGRPIDVHYSLPRDDNTSKEQEKSGQQEMQGTLLVTLRNSMSGQPIDDNEVRRKFQQFGDVKSVTLSESGRPDQRYVEFYDIRAAEEAYDRLRHQGLQDGVMDIALGWEMDHSQRSPNPRRDERYDREYDEPSPRGRVRGRGGRGRGRGRGGYGGDDWDHRDFDRDRDRGRRYGDDGYGGGGGGGGGGRGRGRGGYNSRFDDRDSGYRGGPGGPPPSTNYSGGPGGPSYGGPSGPAPVRSYFEAPVDERLEQARKVQQLLAALKQPQGGAPPSAPPQASAPPVPPPGIPNMPPMPPGPPNHFFPPPSALQQQPHPPYPGSLPPPSAHTGSYPPPMPPQNSTPQPPPPGPPGMPSLASLPPNILALIQQAQGQQQNQQPPQQTATPPMPQYGMPPPQQMSPPPPPMPGVSPANQPGYQQLMAYLQSQTGKR